MSKLVAELAEELLAEFDEEIDSADLSLLGNQFVFYRFGWCMPLSLVQNCFCLYISFSVCPYVCLYHDHVLMPLYLYSPCFLPLSLFPCVSNCFTPPPPPPPCAVSDTITDIISEDCDNLTSCTGTILESLGHETSGDENLSSLSSSSSSDDYSSEDDH